MAGRRVKGQSTNIIEAIRRHPLYQEYYKRLEQAEKDRRFCCHQINHLLDVARIAYIQNLEEGLGFSKDMIYAAAILHDIGKVRQYEEGIPHEIASAEIAEVILKDISLEKYREPSAGETEKNVFSKEEQQEILRAIRSHRVCREEMTSFEKLLYISDKKSRQCFACPVEQECNWSLDKKNMEIDI